MLSTALNMLPCEDFLFYADTLHVPYGTKPKEDVQSYIHQAIESIMTEDDIKAIVIACNTATSLTISDLRQKYAIPVIGMEPAVKPAVEINRATGKRILVFATPLTLQETKYRDLVQRVDEKHMVDSLPLPELVEYCEALHFDRQTIEDYFKRKLADFNLADYGTVVLGCTHFPFYTELLSQILPSHIHIIDGNQGTVKRLTHVLRHRESLRTDGSSDIKLLNSAQSDSYTSKMEEALDFLRRSRKSH
ncbi:glutamate racemase [Paenibacillus sp. JCM 10914]|nr:glutamate racemase [Paenibacillus sp. JCM 10914]